MAFEALLRSGTSLDVCEFSRSVDGAIRNIDRIVKSVNGALRSVSKTS